MDQKIILLSGLYFLSQNQSSISASTIRHLRVILSLFNEEILSEDELEQLIDALRDDNFVTTKNEKIFINREGAALVHSVSEKILGQTALNRLRRMAKDYCQEGAQYIRRLSEQLKTFQEMRQNKVKTVNKSSIRAVGLIIGIEHKRTELFVHRFNLNQQIMRHEDRLSSEINFSAGKFMKSAGHPIITQRDGNILQIISFVQIPSFTLFTQELEPISIGTINRDYVPDWNQLLASTFVENYLGKIGYVRSSWPGRTFIKYQDFEETAANVGSLRESESLRVDFTELHDNQIFIWMESFISPTKRVLDFLYENVQNLTDGQEILGCLADLKLRRIPSGTEVKVKGVLPNTDLTVEKVPSTRYTFMEYWQKVIGIEPTQKIQPLIVIEGVDNDFHYPAEMMYIDRFSLEKHFGVSQVRKPKTETPAERFRIVQNIFNSVKEICENDQNAFFKISLRKYAPTVDELCGLGAFEDAVQILPPILEFHAHSVSLDPLDVFSYGPICGPKNISVTHLILPKDKSEIDINNFFSGLQKMFSSSRLGKLYKPKEIKIIRYDVGADKQDLERKIRKLGKITGNNNIAIAVIPDGNNEIYFTLKRLLPIYTGTPLQSVKLSTFENIVIRKFRGSKILSLKILIKSLNKGEAVWTLSNAAGLSKEKALFVGIGFSRYPREGKVSKCAAVLHDARGDKVSWKVFSTPQQERTITKPWYDSLLYRIRDIIEIEKPARLVFYRTGIMYPQELEAVESSLRECHWLASVKVSFVSILDVGNFRFYLYDRRYDKYRNIPAGYGIIIDDTEAFLSSSNFDDRELRHGTVIPIRLKLEVGDDNIVDVLKEYHDLTYLNWLAPTTTSKYPLVITIAERFAELTRENVSAESMFYLDL